MRRIVGKDFGYGRWNVRHTRPFGNTYHCQNSKEVYEQKVKKKSKFPERILVWQAIDCFGNISEPFITKGFMNHDIYKDECLKKRLLPFIRKHHNINDILFWPDVATSHYTKIVTSIMESQNLNFVLKASNALSVPLCSPIEKFWTICNAKYSNYTNKPKDIYGIRHIWKKLAGKLQKSLAKPSWLPFEKIFVKWVDMV